MIKPATMAFVLAGALLTGVPTALSAQSAPADSARSVLTGAYTAAQATKGEGVFRNTCGNCHTTSQFSGPSFEVVWNGRPLFEMFDQVRNTMPIDNPGGLTREEYTAVIAYILKLNSMPTGDKDLPDDDAALKRIRFDRKP